MLYGRPALAKTFEGFNGTIFAYGQKRQTTRLKPLCVCVHIYIYIYAHVHVHLEIDR